MGQCQSIPEVEDGLTVAEKRILRKVFMGLASRLDGKHITKDDFLQIIRLPGILGERGFDFFDHDGDDLISYNEFEAGLEKICRGDKQHLYDFICFIFDGNKHNDVFIDDFRLMVSHLPPSIICVLVRQVADLNDEEALDWSRRNLVREELDPDDLSVAVDVLAKAAYGNDLNRTSLTYKEFEKFLDKIPAILEYFGSILPYDNNGDDNPFDNYSKTVPRNAEVIRAPLPFHKGTARLNSFKIERSDSLKLRKQKSGHNNWNQYTRAYWCLECDNCKKQVRYCSSCRGNLVPVELPTFVNQRNSQDNQSHYLQCLNCHREIHLMYCSACGTKYKINPVNVKMDHPQDNDNIQCKGGDLYTVSRFNVINKHYVYIRGSFMYYYETDYSNEPTTISFLGDCDVKVYDNRSMEAQNFYGFELTLPMSSDTQQYYSTSINDRDEWVSLIQQVTIRRKLEDEYEIKEQIGTGLTATVFKCVNKYTNIEYAVKIIDKKKLKPSEHTLIQSEIGILSLVNHKNIVKLFDNFEDDNNIYLVMELIKGGELLERIQGRSVLSELEAYRVFSPLVSCIAYLHRMGIVHRDIKPDNVFCGNELWDVKIGDFGFSKVILPDEQIFLRCGTTCYIAPEVLQYNGYSTKADMWSLGVIFYLLLCGRLPFDAPSDEVVNQMTIKKSINFDIPCIQRLSPECQDVLKGLLNKDQTKRYSAENVRRHPWFKKMKQQLQLTEKVSETESPCVDDTTSDSTSYSKSFNSSKLDLKKFAASS